MKLAQSPMSLPSAVVVPSVAVVPVLLILAIEPRRPRCRARNKACCGSLDVVGVDPPDCSSCGSMGVVPDGVPPNENVGFGRGEFGENGIPGLRLYPIDASGTDK